MESNLINARILPGTRQKADELSDRAGAESGDP